MGSVRVAIVGVGNCASSLVQGVEYYRNADPNDRVPGLMHVNFGDYHVSDVEFVAAFDVDAKKVGHGPRRGDRRQREQHHQALRRAADRRHRPARPDLRRPGPVLPRDHRGVRRASRSTWRRRCATPRSTCVVSYLPVGSEQADKFYAQAAIDAGCAFVNALPVFIASDPVWAQEVHRRRPADRRRRHQEPGRRHDRAPRAGEAVRGPRRRAAAHVPAQLRRQHGLHEHAGAHPAGLEEDLEDPVGDLADPARDGARATSTSARRTTCRGSTTASGPTSGSRAAPSATPR